VLWLWASGSRLSTLVSGPTDATSGRTNHVGPAQAPGTATTGPASADGSHIVIVIAIVIVDNKQANGARINSASSSSGHIDTNRKSPPD
jgi:hypothetical protein